MSVEETVRQVLERDTDAADHSHGAVHREAVYAAAVREAIGVLERAAPDTIRPPHFLGLQDMLVRLAQGIDTAGGRLSAE